MTAPDPGPDGGGHPTVLGTLRRMPVTVRVLVLGNLISNLASFLNAFLVLFLKDEGFTAWEAGLVMTALMIGRISGSAVGGAAADRVGYRWVIIGSMLGTAVLTTCLVFVPAVWSGAEVWAGALVAAGAGAAAQAYRPASQAWVVELTPKHEQVMVFSVLRLTFNVGSTLGPLGAALLLGVFSYHALFYVDALTSLTFAALAYVVLRDGGPRAKADAVADEGPRPGVGAVFADRRFLLVVGGLFLTAVAYIQMSAALPLYVTGTGHTERTYAVLLSVNGALVIGLEVVLSKWLQRLPTGLPMAAGMAVLGLGHLAYTGPDTLTVLILATAVWTLGEIVAAPSMMAYPGLVAPPALRGRYIAAATVPQQVGYAVGPMIGVAAWEAWGSAVWLITGSCAVAAAVLVAAGAGLRRPAAAGPEPDRALAATAADPAATKESDTP